MKNTATQEPNDFVALCYLAQDGDGNAIQKLHQQLYKQVYLELGSLTNDEILLEDLSTEFLDRYLLGWVSDRDNTRIAPMIADVKYNFRAHMAECLSNFKYRVIHHRLQESPEGMGAVTNESDLPVVNHEEGESVGLDAFPDHNISTPERSVIDKDLVRKFTLSLPQGMRNCFRMMLEGETEEDIAEALGLDDRTIRRFKAEIRERAANYFDV